MTKEAWKSMNGVLEDLCMGYMVPVGLDSVSWAVGELIKAELANQGGCGALKNAGEKAGHQVLARVWWSESKFWNSRELGQWCLAGGAVEVSTGNERLRKESHGMFRVKDRNTGT